MRFLFLGLNVLIMLATLASSPFAPPAVAQFVATAFQITQRNDVPASMAVAVMTPNNQSQTMAFDVLPGSNAVMNAQRGWGWIDICSRRNLASSLWCASSGAMENYVYYGSWAYNGAGSRDVHIVMGNGPTPVSVGVFTLDNSGQPIFTVNGTIRAQNFSPL